MKLAELQDQLLGEWTGQNLLRLSWQTPSDFYSETKLTVAAAANGYFLTFTYTWNYEGKPQAGLLVLAYDPKQNTATAAWGDSWHMNAKLLNSVGTIDEHGVINVHGFYEAPPGPDWGWRTVITPKDAQHLQLTMYNCAPDGSPEDLAVQADYQRA